MTTYIWRDNEWLEVERDWNPRPRIHLITDTMPKTWHPATKKYSDSRSDFRKMTKESGCVELGSDTIGPRKSSLPPVKETIKESLQKLESRSYRDDLKQRMSKLESVSDWDKPKKG